MKCDFCGQEKPFSTVLNVSYADRHIDRRGRDVTNLNTVAVCPECREKHTISEVYRFIIVKVVND